MYSYTENKVWNRLRYFKSLMQKRAPLNEKVTVGVLGCMAERISNKILQETCASFVCGPDAYRSLPTLIESSSSSQKMANIQLSLEETYADIQPVRKASTTEAFVSIMRGCNNMCSYCIVPFTRGRERSRKASSIVEEVKALSSNGVKECVLLGQNVNSYHDNSDESKRMYPATSYTSTPGFQNLYRSRQGAGARFADLLDIVSSVDSEMRVRFTSPHPKDFPDEVLELIRDRPNICSSLHLPAQSGSTSVLSRMRRGYSRESYIDLVKSARQLIPGVSISSDFISGFCGETEEEHQDTLSLIEEIRFDQAYMYAYSLRDKTHAFHNYEDDVPETVKQRRLREVIDTFRRVVQTKNFEDVVNTCQIVLIDGFAKKSSQEHPVMSGRTDSNKRILFAQKPSPCLINYNLSSIIAMAHSEEFDNHASGPLSLPKQGDYVLVRVTEAKGHVLRGNLVGETSITHYTNLLDNGLL